MKKGKSFFKTVALSMAVLVFSGVAIAQVNLFENGDFEDWQPAFWTMDGPMNNLFWAEDQAYESMRSLKISKETAGEAAAWESVNQANIFWNNVVNETYTIGAYYMTEAVNTDPANDDARIGLKYVFYADGQQILADQYLWVDQSSADMEWTELSSFITLTSEPDSVVCWAMMGSEATGTVWFDDFVLNSDPNWTAEFWGGDCEHPVGWKNWHAEDGGFAYAVASDNAHSGRYVGKIEELDDEDDEMVLYTLPVPAEPNTDYFISFWAKIDDINTNDLYAPTSPVLERDNARAGITFFFHEGDWAEGWGNLADQFVYLDQRTITDEWTQYWAIVTSPETATGISVRARFTSFVTGCVLFDDFSFVEVDLGDDLMVNGDLETVEPAFWMEDMAGGDLIWDDMEANAGLRSLKIDKPNTGTAACWKSVNQANIHWNNVIEETYAIGAFYKTDNVNTDPANDDERIGIMYGFYLDGEPILTDQYLWIDQANATTDWTELSSFVTLTSEPDSVVCMAMMGSEATGTVWFDDFTLDSSPNWTAEFWGGDCEHPVGWKNWHAEDAGFAYMIEVPDVDAHSGTHVVKMEERDDGDDEMVFYSMPVELNRNAWYEFSVWIKTVDITPLDPSYYPSHVMLDRINERMGLCFFFHEGDWTEGWGNLADQYIYAQQIEESEGWTHYRAMAYAGETVTGASVRARFTSFPQGEVWYDDFTIREVSNAPMDVDDYYATQPELPSTVALHQNYPNPFNSSTHINYSLPNTTVVKVEIFDVLGRHMTTLVNEVQPAGMHSVSFVAKDNDLSSGIYFYRLSTNNISEVRKMIYMK